MTANQDLTASAAQGYAMLEESQMRLQKLLKDSTNVIRWRRVRPSSHADIRPQEILVMNSEVAQYMTKLEEASNRTQQIEAEAVKLDLTNIGIVRRRVQSQRSLPGC